MLNINLAGLGLPLQCLGLRSYAGQLALTLLAPLLLAALFVLVCILRHCRCSGVSVNGHCACSGGGERDEGPPATPGAEGRGQHGASGPSGAREPSASAMAPAMAPAVAPAMAPAMGGLLGGLPWLLGLSFLVLPDGLLTLTPNPNPNPNR